MVTEIDGRYAFLKFDLNSVPGSIISAKLRMYQRLSFKDIRVVYDVADDSCTETGITWNNKPSFENERASITTNSAWNEWDVSSYVAQEYASDKTITMVVKDPANNGVCMDFRTKEFDPNLAPVLIVDYSTVQLSVFRVKTNEGQLVKRILKN